MRKDVRKQLQDRLNQEQATGDTLGIIVYWSMDGVKISASDLENIFDRHGLDKKSFFPPSIKPSSALRKARQFVMARKDNAGYLCRSIVKDRVWGIVREDRDQLVEKNAYQQEAKIRFDPVSTNVSVDGTGTAGDIARSIADEYMEYLSFYTSEDMQAMLRRNLLAMNCVFMRRHGGFYFVQPQYRDLIKAHQAVLEDPELDCEVNLLFLRKDQPDNVKSVSRDTKHSLEAELKDLNNKIQKYKNNPPSRDSTLSGKMQEFKDLQARVDYFAGILDFQSQGLNQGIDDCKALLRALLEGTKSDTQGEEKTGQDETEKPTEEPQKETPKPQPSVAGMRSRRRRLVRRVVR